MKTKFIFFAFLFFAAYTCYAAGSEPGNWRWRNDDPTTKANGATWKADLDTGFTLTSGNVFRLRIQSSSGNLTGTGQIFLQYMDGGAYSSTALSGPNWERNSATGQPQPVSSYRSTGETTDPAGIGRADNNGMWTTITPRTGGASQALAPTGPGFTTNIIMAGTNETLPDTFAIPQANLDSTVAYESVKNITRGPLNDYNLLGPPDYLNYGLSDTTTIAASRWTIPSFFGQENGNERNASTPSYAIVGEAEWALKANTNLPVASGVASPNLTNAQLIPGHIYFFRLRAYGAKGSSSGFTSPNGVDNTAPIGNTPIKSWYSDYAVPSPAGSNAGSPKTDYRAFTPYPYLIGGNGITPLSVSYARALSATASNGTVTLSWATATETNNKQFTVQRSSNGTDFTQIGVVASKATNGNSSATLSYAFTDNNPVSGINYYRLQQEDISGNTSPSNIASATIAKGASVRLYPNPAASTVNVENLPAGSAIVVTNIAGYAVYTGTVTSSNFSINVRNLSAGIYFLQYMTNGVKNTIKFVKQ
ncbi:MAG: T9SS type A sorting domain-containing protein [Chitinophagaceae bacterium]|jgi:hypothetical protein|nr:T9SS type A sorting domain-containing protein [Chitinophagaceae bacterium]